MKSEINEEYVTPNGEKIQMYKDNISPTYHVICWNADEINHWWKSYETEEAARKEFERWRK